MNLFKKLSLLKTFAAAILLLGVNTYAHAQSTTFAQFFDIGGNAFDFTNNGSSSTFTSNSVPVIFLFAVPSSYGTGAANETANGFLTISGNVSHPATGSGFNPEQDFSNINLNFVDSSGDNLLTATDVSSGSAVPTLIGSGGNGGSATLSGAANSNNDNLEFTSAFWNFADVSKQNFSLSLSSINNTSGGSGITINPNGYLNSFTSSVTGTFASNPAPTPNSPAVPEPNPALIITLAMGSPAFGRRLSKDEITQFLDLSSTD